MKLLQTTFYSAIITSIRIFSGFIASKVIAVYAGPTGIYLIGQFSNLLSIGNTFSTGAINNGVVKYISEYHEDEVRKQSVIKASIKITLICSFITGLILIFGSTFWSHIFFKNPAYSTLIIVFGVTLILYALNTLILSILNGLGEIKKYTIVNTCSTLIGLLLTVVLVYKFQAIGALYSLIIAPSIVFFISAFIVRKEIWAKLNIRSMDVSREVLSKFGQFSLMSIVTILTIPLTQIILRSFIVANAGETSAGIWQGMMRISDGYLMVVTTALSTYYLPKLSSLIEINDIKKEMWKGYKLIAPTLLFMFGCIFLLRETIIRVLYSSEFDAMSQLFRYQLIGDFLKMLSWILAYLMLAKSMTKLFIITEIGFNLTYVILGYYMINNFGVSGATIAYMCSYGLYFIFFAVTFRKYII